jgi:4-diphosphocytidyl-2-C-methyl-D-erythritol kinase
MWLAAPAKVNLCLRVVGKRSDGYHDLQSWMQKLALCDQVLLTVVAGEGISWSCDEPSLATPDDNLAVRAAKVFLGHSRRAAGKRIGIHLRKVIPVAAGLGGGSSDAGAVLRGLNTLMGDEFTPAELQEMACPLGADVPFFAGNDRAVFAEGIGERMRSVPSLDDCWFLLVNPGFFVATAWVFANLTLTGAVKNSKLPCFELFQPPAAALYPLLYNDLEEVTGAAHPEIGSIKAALLAAGASVALMSGSGPTVFGVWPDAGGADEGELRRIVGILRRQYGEKVYLTRSYTGASPSGKAPGFDPGIRRFESFRPSQP